MRSQTYSYFASQGVLGLNEVLIFTLFLFSSIRKSTLGFNFLRVLPFFYWVRDFNYNIYDIFNLY